ncbi:MAG: NHL repeat-containing protein [Candidatus Aminicenantales bacterium]
MQNLFPIRKKIVAKIMPKKQMIFSLCLIVLLGFIYSREIAYAKNDRYRLNFRHGNNNDLQSPVRIALGSGGLIYVTDFQKNCVAVIDLTADETKIIKTIAVKGHPLGIAVDHEGWIYVGNSTNNRVEVYVPKGNFGHRRPKFRLEGNIKRPNDIAIAPSGLIYVVASDENLVKIYNPDGSFHSSFGGTGDGYGQFNFPTGIAIDEVNGEVIVSDFLNRRIQVFDYDGNWLRAIYGGGMLGSSAVDRPQGLAVDEQGRIYVVDSHQACIFIVDRYGAPLATLGEYGQDKGQLRIPLDIVIDQDGNAIVTSNQNSRIEIFQGVAK